MSGNQRFSRHYPSYVTNAYGASRIDALRFSRDNWAKTNADNAAIAKALATREQPVLFHPAGSFSRFDPSPPWMDLGGGKERAPKPLSEHKTRRSGRGKSFLFWMALFALGVVVQHFM
jgi:hypothetical protein